MAQRHAAPDIRPMKIVSTPSRAPEIVGEIAALLRSYLEGENLGAKLKFDYGEAGVVFIDGRRMPNKVHTRDEPADCTVKLDPFLHLRMLRQEVDQVTAFRQGKMRISGDVGIAVRLGPIVLRKSGRTN
ncbi:MAG TPA: SCP2 sterol-binding domain-containing protein [Parvibaculum sp.]|nr:SCP2 sterol-binding domain-containing protein [Parvibaculum sp.]